MTEEEPKISPGLHGGERSDHPAFGQISASRVSGHNILYGSDFEHRAYITVRIKRSSLERDLSRDWHFAKGELIEVALSEAQWASFVSAMNIGEGVPCTIQRVNGERMPTLPLRQQAKHFATEIRDRVSKAAGILRGLRDRVRAGVGGLSKGKQAELIGPIESAIMEIESNVPFVSDSFDKHVETTIEKAKQELHGYMMGVITRAGLEHLGASPPITLIEDQSDDANRGTVL